MNTPRFLDAGEAALVVEFGRSVDPLINDQVIALDTALGALALAGIVETVPTYRSLMIHYDPLVLDREALIGTIRQIEDAGQAPQHDAGRWTIPCCYEGDCADDLGRIAEAMGLLPERVVDLHAGALYRVYMYGFSPGFAYLGGLPEVLSISRRAVPRPPIPPNTIMIAGGLAAIATFPMPTGWWLIGRTPERLFQPSRDAAFLLAVGDTVRFAPIDRDTFGQLDARSAVGEVVARREGR
jgi:KipI family sensor histidine kinase inhibitor